MGNQNLQDGAPCAINSLRTAAAYIRVSTDDQTEYSPAAQLRELREYAGRNHLILDERYVYADEGLSGRRAEKRPRFMQMISDAKSDEHPFDVILVHKFDRFARSREDSVVYKAMLKRAGVEVISIKEPLADSTYSGLIESIYESVAEAYSINLGQEVRKGMTEKAMRGEPQTAPPFGYRLEKGAQNGGKPAVSPAGRRRSASYYVPHETEAALVHQIFERFAAGEGFFPLAKWMNAQGITTHRGSRFENRTIEYMLRNPVYIGKLRWNPKRRTRRNYNDPDTMIVNGNHVPIVEPELWDAVQCRMMEIKARWRYHARPAAARKHWLCGIVRCAACGTTLIVAQGQWFKCNAYVRGACSYTQHISISLLESAFLSRLQQDMLSSSGQSVRLIRASTASEQTLQHLRSALAKAQKKRDRLTDAYLNEAIGIEEFKRLRPQLDDEISSAASALAEAEAQETPIDTASALRSNIEQALKTLTSDTADTPAKYEAANAIIERCLWDKSTLTLSITYRISV